MNKLLRFTCQWRNSLGVILCFTLLAGCTQDQEKESDPVPNVPQVPEVPEVPTTEKPALTCLLTRQESNIGNYVIYGYGADKRLSSVYKYYKSTSGGFTINYTLIRDQEGRITGMYTGEKGKAQDIVLDYDNLGRWIKTTITDNTPGPSFEITAEYNLEGQISKISNIKTFHYNVPMIFDNITTFEYQNGNIVKAIHKGLEWTSITSYEYNLNVKNKPSYITLFNLYLGEGWPLSINTVSKTSSYSEEEGHYGSSEMIYEYNEAGYPIVTAIKNYEYGKYYNTTTRKFTYNCE